MILLCNKGLWQLPNLPCYHGLLEVGQGAGGGRNMFPPSWIHLYRHSTLRYLPPWASSSASMLTWLPVSLCFEAQPILPVHRRSEAFRHEHTLGLGLHCAWLGKSDHTPAPSGGVTLGCSTHGVNNLLYKEPKSTHFWFCRPCSLSQLITPQKQPQTIHREPAGLNPNKIVIEPPNLPTKEISFLHKLAASGVRCSHMKTNIFYCIILPTMPIPIPHLS